MAARLCDGQAVPSDRRHARERDGAARRRRRARCRRRSSRSVGEVPYDWRIDTDVLRLGRQCRRRARDPRSRRDRAPAAPSPSWSTRKSGPTRFDAVMRSTERRRRRGRALSGAICAAPGAGADACSGSRTPAAGSPARTASRRAPTASCASSTSATSSEQRLAYLSRFDALTGEMNRWHMTEVLEADPRGSGQAALLLRLHAGRRSTISAASTRPMASTSPTR